MTDRALTEEAVLAGLQDIRLPPEATGGLLAELMVAAGFGLVLALLLAQALRLFTRVRTTPPAARSLAEKVAALSGMPEQERQMALLHLLKRHRPEVFATFSSALYQRDGLPDCTALEAELARHV